VIKKVHINMCPILDGYGVIRLFDFLVSRMVHLGYALSLEWHKFQRLAFNGNIIGYKIRFRILQNMRSGLQSDTCWCNMETRNGLCEMWDGFGVTKEKFHSLF
jgi:hypothetical protein